ncbi:hypothetical protein B9Q04_09215 [Candidatus Marsarchaeota G2 archaeon BE_D]|uniref:Uncharacterized protein n=1 Tax=Candidatus Marsarchaeota G2 archaeon BE_D TaxID=1978158 RepID=A0A2R6CA07_9ARCH|nr:MAG: hypothetical protein B9Q04_09215 [Candidatus Marsarchaeota G2 archaeon BE_D]
MGWAFNILAATSSESLVLVEGFWKSRVIILPSFSSPNNPALTDFFTRMERSIKDSNSSTLRSFTERILLPLRELTRMQYLL